MPLPIPKGLPLRDAVIWSVLHDERWYGDGPPRWIINSGTPFEKPSQTAAQACEQRENTEKHLVRHDSNDSRIPHFTKIIDNCHSKGRCDNGACPECTRALQRWMVANVHQAAAPLRINSKKLILVSLVPDYAKTDAMHPNLNWEKVITRLCEDMASAGIPWAIGGSDFSVNIDKVNGGAPILQGQFWMLIEEPKGKWRGLLKALINDSGKLNNYRLTPVGSCS